MWFFHKKREKAGHQLDDLDRLNSIETRRLKAELKRLRLEQERLRLEAQKEEWKARLAELKADLYGNEETEEENSSPMDTLLLTLLTPIVNKFIGGEKSTSVPLVNNSPSPPQTNKEFHLTDEELKDIAKRVPKKYLRLAKKFNEEQLKLFIENQLPNVDADTVTRAVNLLKNQ